MNKQIKNLAKLVERGLSAKVIPYVLEGQTVRLSRVNTLNATVLSVEFKAADGHLISYSWHDQDRVEAALAAIEAKLL